MPEFEFWFSGSAIIGAAVFVFTGILALIPVKPLNHVLYRRAAWLLPLLAGGLWYNLAESEAEKAKPQRDYAYFDVSRDPRDDNGQTIRLVSIATGPLRNVNVAIQTADERKKKSRSYIFSSNFPIIPEGGTLLNLNLPAGDYWIDSDQPAKMGQVLEHFK